MKYSKEIKVGIFALVGLATFLAGLSYLRGTSVIRRPTILYAVYPNVDGLTNGARVLLNGFHVGKVDNISFVNQGKKVLVTFHINEPVDITKDARATVVSTDLVGTKGVSLIQGNLNKFVQNGDTLRDSLALGMIDGIMKDLNPVLSDVQALVQNLDKVVVAIKHTTQDSANRANRIAKSLEVTMHNAAAFSNDLPGLSKRITLMVDSLKQFAGALNRYDPKINKILTNAGTLTDTLAGNSAQITAILTNAKTAVNSLKNTLDKIDKGEGTLGKLLKDQQVYDNLNAASKNLETLLADVQNNPKRYVHFSVFGRKDKTEKIDVKKK